MSPWELPWFDPEDEAEMRLDALQAGGDADTIEVFGRADESFSVAPTSEPVVDCFGHPWRSRASEQPRLLPGVPSFA